MSIWKDIYVKEKALIWTGLFGIVIGLIFLCKLSINYSFVVFASMTGGLIRYSYQMKNQTYEVLQTGVCWKNLQSREKELKGNMFIFHEKREWI